MHHHGYISLCTPFFVKGETIMLSITVNGKDLQVEESLTVSVFLERQGYSVARIAVELNGSILPKAAYSQTVLKENDRMEVVSFVGGG